MKIKSLALVFATSSFAALTPALHAQYERAWTFGYDVPTSAPLRPGAMVALPDGGMVCTQVAYVDTSQTLDASILSVVKFSANGDRVWEILNESSGGTYLRSDLAVSSEGTIYLAARQTTGAEGVTGIDGAGHVLWNTPISGSYEIAAIDVLPGGDAVVACMVFQGSLYPFTYLIRINPAGQIVWQSGMVQMWPQQIDVSDTGRIVVSGPEDWLEEYQWGIVAVFENDGTLAWSSRAPADGRLTPIGSSAWYEDLYALTFGPSGSVYSVTHGIEASGSPSNPTEVPGYALHAFSSTGQRFAWTITSGSGSAYPDSVAVDESAGFIYVSGWDSDCDGCQEHAALWQYDLAGQEQWLRRIDSPGATRSRAAGLRVLEGGRVAVASIAEESSPTGGTGTHTIFDSAGNVVWRTSAPGNYEVASGLFWHDEVARDQRGNLFVQHARGSGIFFQKIVPGGPAGTPICGAAPLNSTGASGRIRAIGSDDVANDNAVLLISDLPPNAFTMVLASQSPGFLPGVGGGQGNLCLGGNIGRYDEMHELRRIRSDGTASFQLDLDALQASIGRVMGVPGQNWYFQAWYRDVNPSVTSNLTNAVQLTLR